MKVGEIWENKVLPENQVEIVDIKEEEDYELYSWTYETTEVISYKFVRTNKTNNIFMSSDNMDFVFKLARIHFINKYRKLYESRGDMGIHSSRLSC